MSGVVHAVRRGAAAAAVAWSVLGLAASGVWAAPAYLVRDINPGQASSSPDGLVAVDGVLYFAAFEPEQGRELWRSDGTADGTTLVSDLFLGQSSASPFALTAWNDHLGFVTYVGGGKTALWRSDGTAAGTINLSGQFRDLKWTLPNRLTSFGPDLFFSTGVGTVWQTDGGAAGTIPLPRPPQPPYVSFLGPRAVFAAPDAVLVSYYAGALCCESYDVWRIERGGQNQESIYYADGPGGTGNAFEPKEFTRLGTGTAFTSNGTLWQTDCTTGSCTARALYHATSGDPVHLTAAGDAVFFAAAAEPGGGGLWRTDGTGEGTILVHSFTGLPEKLTVVGDRLFFAADAALWVTDGTVQGSAPVGGIAVPGESPEPDQLLAVGDQLLFTTSTVSGRADLWLTPPAGAGAARHIQSLGDAPAGGRPRSFTIAADRVFFSRATAESGTELWAIPHAALNAPPPLPCAGDCNDDGRVTIDEILTGVADTLGHPVGGDCSAALCHAECGPGPSPAPPGIACLVSAVSHALQGCPVDPCVTDADCDDGNGCSVDRCTADGCTAECVCD